jgi:hypothetical protein
MKIQATCQTCQARISVDSRNAGKKARCPKCREIIEIPNVDSSQQSTAVPDRGERPDSPRRRPSRPSSSNSRSEGKDKGEESQRKSRPPAPRRRRESFEEDIWAQPLSSYSSPAIEEHEYEEYGIPQRERRIRSAEDSDSSTQPGMKVPLIMAGIGLGSAILFGGIGFAFPPAAFAGTAISGLIGFVLSIWGGMKLLSNAFEDSPMTGFLYLICGPYAIYFLFSRWDINRNPFLINLLGSLVWLASFAVSAIVVQGE